MTLTLKDRKVLVAFTDQSPASSKKLTTDGTHLDFTGMGGHIAEWRGHTIYFYELTSQAMHMVQHTIKKMIPVKWIAENPRGKPSKPFRGYDGKRRKNGQGTAMDYMKRGMQVGNTENPAKWTVKVYDSDGKLHSDEGIFSTLVDAERHAARRQSIIERNGSRMSVRVMPLTIFRNSAVQMAGRRVAGRAEVLARSNPAPGDKIASDDLVLYIENSATLHRQQYEPIQKNLRTKQAKGTYDSKKAVKLFKYLADNGAQLYTKDYGGSGNGSYGSFDPATRRLAAETLCRRFEDDSTLGNFDYLLPKKYQVTNPVAHFPQTERGRPRKTRGRPAELKPAPERIFPGVTRGRFPTKQWWILDLYGGTGTYILKTYIGEGTKPTALAEAKSFVGKQMPDALGKIKTIQRVELAGPYEEKPGVDWPRL